MADVTPTAQAVAALDRSDPRWEELRRIVDERSLLRGDFTLTSGRKSTYLFQLRQTTMLPKGQYLIGTIIAEFMAERGIGTIGGPVIGAIPMIAATAFASHLAGKPVDAFFVRKAAKEHGAKERIDGYVNDGAEVLAVDDVTTTAGSIVEAINVMKSEHRCQVEWALSILDREEGAAENLAKHGIKLASIFRTSDFDLG
ncbi:MAG: orotate phosphoribosyltransferase [Bauldia sp.]